MEVTYRLGAWMLVAAGIEKDLEAGLAACRAAIADGSALRLFLANVRTQGGDVEKMLALRGKYRSKHSFEVKAPVDGYVRRIDAWNIGLAGVHLGVGRDKTSDPVAPDVGFHFARKSGEKVRKGETVCTVWGKDSSSLEAARALIESAFEFGSEAPAAAKLVLEEIS
jgi:pyrimidine-nucleoside phosphorylase